MVSIVVPVFNAKNYLAECLDSVIEQSYKDIEIVCIDDGSSDGSGDLLDEYAEKYEKINAFHQINRGVVEARKNGIKNAKGEFITFADADDILPVDAVEILVKHADDVDMVCAGIEAEERNGTVQIMNNGIPDGSYVTPEEMRYVYCNMIRFNGEDVEGILPYLFGKLYKRDLLLEIIDETDSRIKYAEDRELIYRYILKAGSIRTIKDTVYMYRYNNMSVIRAANSHVMHDLNYLYESLIIPFSEHEFHESLIGQLEQVICSRVSAVTHYMGFKSRNRTIRFIIPFYNILYGKKLVLYGAGEVGWNYYRQTEGMKGINWILWVDRNPVDPEVSHTSELENTCFDLLVIAIENEVTANKIIEDLCETGIKRSCIIWEAPLVLGH